MTNLMKRYFVFLGLMAVFFTAASSIMAQDEDATPTPVPKPTPKTMWGGAYAGAFIGGNIGKAKAQTTTVFTQNGYFNEVNPAVIADGSLTSLNVSGGDIGATVGYNYQFGKKVIGAEADLAWARSVKSGSFSGSYSFPSANSFTVDHSVKTDFLATARVRGGYARRNFLFFGTGGAATTDVKYEGDFSDDFASATESAKYTKLRLGWTAGGGFEYKAGIKWSFKAEYLYADLGKASGTSTNLSAQTNGRLNYPDNVFTHTVDLKEHMFRIGLNYHF